MSKKNTRLSEWEWQNLHIHSLFQQSPIGTTVEIFRTTISFNNHLFEPLNFFWMRSERRQVVKGDLKNQGSKLSSFSDQWSSIQFSSSHFSSFLRFKIWHIHVIVVLWIGVKQRDKFFQVLTLIKLKEILLEITAYISKKMKSLLSASYKIDVIECGSLFFGMCFEVDGELVINFTAESQMILTNLSSAIFWYWWLSFTIVSVSNSDNY